MTIIYAFDAAVEYACSSQFTAWKSVEIPAFSMFPSLSASNSPPYHVNTDQDVVIHWSLPWFHLALVTNLLDEKATWFFQQLKVSYRMHNGFNIMCRMHRIVQ